MSNRLADKITLVTGAGSGLGEATARRFAAEGAHVYLTDLNGDAIERIAAEIGTKATARVQDVTDEEDWDTLMAEIVAAYGKLDVIVNNAGIAINGTAEDTSLEDWRKTQAVNHLPDRPWDPMIRTSRASPRG